MAIKNTNTNTYYTSPCGVSGTTFPLDSGTPLWVQPTQMSLTGSVAAWNFRVTRLDTQEPAAKSITLANLTSYPAMDPTAPNFARTVFIGDKIRIQGSPIGHSSITGMNDRYGWVCTDPVLNEWQYDTILTSVSGTAIHTPEALQAMDLWNIYLPTQGSMRYRLSYYINGEWKTTSWSFVLNSHITLYVDYLTIPDIAVEVMLVGYRDKITYDEENKTITVVLESTSPTGPIGPIPNYSN